MAEQPFSRRRALGLGFSTAGAALLAGLAGCGAPTSPPGVDSATTAEFTARLDVPAPLETRQLTVGFVPITCAAPLVNAAALGVFAQYGLDVTLRRYTGWAELWTAYVAGELDATQMLAPMPLAIHHGFASGQRDTRVPLVTNTDGNSITVSRELHGEIAGPQDFAGLRLGLPFDYSMHNLLTRDYLAGAGIDPTADVDLRIMRPADMVSALSVGEIDAFCLPDQFSQRAVAEGVGVIHTSTAEIWAGHPCCCFSVAEDFSSSHPTTYTALVSALVDAALWTDAQDNRAASAQLLSPAGRLNTPQPVLDAVLTGDYQDGTGRRRRDPDRIGFQPYPHQSFGVWILDHLQQRGLTGSARFATAQQRELAVDEVFDPDTSRPLVAALDGNIGEAA